MANLLQQKEGKMGYKMTVLVPSCPEKVYGLKSHIKRNIKIVLGLQLPSILLCYVLTQDILWACDCVRVQKLFMKW